MKTSLPKTGHGRQAIMQIISEARVDDVDWHAGRLFGIVYFLNEELHQLASDVYGSYLAESASKPHLWPSLRRFESEIIAMVLQLFHGDDTAVGTVASGGTESIFLAIKAARDWTGANRSITGSPEIIAPQSAHPAFDKAAHFLGLNVIRVPLLPDLQADIPAMTRAITANTVMLVGSAPGYSHGIIDPIGELGILAEKRDLWLYVDACHGFLTPFIKQLGYPVPDFDFAVPGVTTISVDLHKWGFAPKGVSLIFYRDKAYQIYQGFDFNNWPAGRYGSNTFAGTRPGGPAAAAWAVMNYLGEQGYLQIAKQVMEAKQKLIEGINEIDGLQIIGNPSLGVISFGSQSFDIFAVADEIQKYSWFTARTSDPPAMHLVITPQHLHTLSAFLSDLAGAVAVVKSGNLSRVNFEPDY